MKKTYACAVCGCLVEYDGLLMDAVLKHLNSDHGKQLRENEITRIAKACKGLSSSQELPPVKSGQRRKVE